MQIGLPFPLLPLIPLPTLPKKFELWLNPWFLTAKAVDSTEGMGSLFLFLNDQRKSFIKRRKGLHHQDLSSDLWIDIIQSMEELHQRILMLKRCNFVIDSTGTFTTSTTWQRPEIQQLIPSYLKTSKEACCCWISFHNCGYLLLKLRNSWSISLRKMISKSIPYFKSRISINHIGCDMRRDRIQYPWWNHGIVLGPS